MALAMKRAVVSTRASPKVASRKALVCRADGFIGSTTNLIMIATTAATLSAARFGLAPSVQKRALGGNGLKLTDSSDVAGVYSKDPSGFTIVDVLAMGTAGHILGIGIVLGLKNQGLL